MSGTLLVKDNGILGGGYQASIRSLNLRRTLDDQAIAKLEGKLNDVINVIPASLIE